MSRERADGPASSRSGEDGDASGVRPDGDGGSPAAADLPPLPAPDARPARLLAVPGTVVQRFDPGDVVADAVAAVEPDVVVAAPPDASVVDPALAGLDAPLLHPGRGMRVAVEAAAGGRVLVAAPPRLDDLPATPAGLSDGGEGAGDGSPGRHVCLLTDRLSLSVDPHRRRTELEGATAYVEALGPAWLGDGVTHVSTALRPGYATTHAVPGSEERLSVHGAGASGAGLGVGSDDATDAMAALSVYPNGAVDADALDPERYGLRGLSGVSDARAGRLREAGFRDRSSVADAGVAALADLPSVGRSTAASIRASARAVSEGAVVPTGDGSLPSGEPVFVDVETDGLAASTAWLVGVLDGGADDGTYLAFRERDPREPGEHLEAFATWLTGSAPGRPVVAWNGHGFDFPVIGDQFRRHCPEYVDDWEGRYRFDPLHWADRQGNAALPGRTNRLEAVAGALGFEPATRGLDGAAVARRYVAGRDRVERADDPAAVPAPDWDRLEAYCEDDVRALATIYDALREAARRPPETGTTDPTGADTTQGSLSDFG